MVLPTVDRSCFRKALMAVAAFAQSWESRSRKLAITGVGLATLLITIHPVAGDGLWWELNKGRAVLDGNWLPTAALIAGPTGADADWLSGVIPYTLMSIFGMSGLMALKLAAGMMMTSLLLRRTAMLESEASWPVTGIALLATLLAARQALEPGPVLLDALGFVSVFLATESLAGQQSSRPWGVALLLLILWANLGPRVIVGLLIAGPHLWCKSTRLVAGLGGVAAMLGAASLTPAGGMTLRNSLIQTWPSLLEDLAYLQAAGWQPWWQDIGTAESIAFLLLSLFALFAAYGQPSGRRLFGFLAAQFLACASAKNLPLAALWLMLSATTPAGSRTVAFAGSRSSAMRTPPRRPAESTISAASVPVISRWQTVALGTVWLWVVWTATHPWSNCESGLGWGLDPRLNPDAFAASLADTSVTGNAHCVGVREAGLLSWYRPKGMQPFDTPTSALLNRRLRTHVLLTSDLSRRWQTPHRRPDGSWGGWWQTIKERGTTLLVLPAENRELITALEPTVWKPFSLNAVSLVYGMAGDPGGTGQIVKTLSLREFVDRGAWTYQLGSEAGSGHLEFFAWPGDTAAIHQSLRLARVFRAMEMHFAAFKVLQAVPRENNAAVLREFFENQWALGYRERVIAGRSSEFRFRVCLLDHDRTANDMHERLNWTSPAETQENDPLAQAAVLYVAGDLKGALTRLPADRSESRYARAVLLLEAGQPGQAQSILKELTVPTVDPTVSVLARQLSATLAQ